MNRFNQILEALKQTDLSTAEDIFRHMIRMNIQYGYINKRGERVHGISSDEEFYKTYKLQSPKELEDSKLGVCWDQVEYERSLFLNSNIPIKTYYIQIQPGNSHTFLVFQQDEKLYWFEHSWYDCRGIHGPYKNLKSIYTVVYREMVKQAKKERTGSNNELMHFCEYQQPKYGIGCQQFMDYMSKFKRIQP